MITTYLFIFIPQKINEDDDYNRSCSSAVSGSGDDEHKVLFCKANKSLSLKESMFHVSIHLHLLILQL